MRVATTGSYAQGRGSRHQNQTHRLGLRLAERTGLTGLSVNLLVDEAGVSKGTFFHHFGDRASYLLALHREFHDRIAEHIDQTISDLPPGRERLLAGATVYLDMCLQQRGIRALLLEARAEPAVAQEITRRNAEFAHRCEPDFAALGRGIRWKARSWRSP